MCLHDSKKHRFYNVEHLTFYLIVITLLEVGGLHLKVLPLNKYLIFN